MKLKKITLKQPVDVDALPQETVIFRRKTKCRRAAFMFREFNGPWFIHVNGLGSEGNGTSRADLIAKYGGDWHAIIDGAIVPLGAEPGTVWIGDVKDCDMIVPVDYNWYPHRPQMLKEIGGAAKFVDGWKYYLIPANVRHLALDPKLPQTLEVEGGTDATD